MTCPTCEKPVCRYWHPKYAEVFPIIAGPLWGVIARVTTTGPWHVFCQCSMGHGRFHWVAWLRWLREAKSHYEVNP